MIVTQNNKLNVIPGGIIPVVHVSQYDVNRAISFTLYDGNSAASLEEGTTATIEGTKPDGHGFQYSGTISGNVVTFNTTQQMTVLAGGIECKLTLTNGSQVIGTAMFILDVEKAGINDETIISDTELPLIISTATEQMERAEAAAVSANASKIASGSSALIAGNAAAICSSILPVVEHDAAICASILPVVRGYKDEAEMSKIAAGSSMLIAGNYSEDAEAWAVGKRNGTDVPSTDPTYHNSSKYWADIASQYARGGLIYKGSITFANIPTSDMRSGDMYNMEDDFTTDSRFQEGPGVFVKAGSNIVWNGLKWDVLAIGAVTGVKGNAESTYRHGDVNITPANIGLGNVNNTSDADKPVSTAQQTALNGKLGTSGDGKNVTVTFTSNDLAANTTAKTNTTTNQPSTVVQLASGEKLSSILNKISSMFASVRKLWNTVGTTAIDTAYGATLTAQMANLKSYNTYSTSETWTGEYWYDGRKIYGRIITYNTLLTISPTTWTDTGLRIAPNDIDCLISAFCGTNDGTSSSSNGCYALHAMAELPSGTNVKALAARTNPVYAKWLYLKYTKTT